MSTFYERLQQECGKKGTTPTELCRSIGISTGNLGRWSNGKLPSDKVLEKMAESLCCEVPYLRYGDIKNAPAEAWGEAVGYSDEVQDLAARILRLRDADQRTISALIDSLLEQQRQ